MRGKAMMELNYIIEEMYRVGVIKASLDPTTKKHHITIEERLLTSYPYIYAELIDQWIKKLDGLCWDTAAGINEGGVIYASMLAYALKKSVAVILMREDSAEIARGVVTGKKVLVVGEKAVTGHNLEKSLKAITNAGGNPIALTVLFDLEKGARERIKWAGIPYIPLVRLSKVIEIIPRLTREE